MNGTLASHKDEALHAIIQPLLKGYAQELVKAGQDPGVREEPNGSDGEVSHFDSLTRDYSARIIDAFETWEITGPDGLLDKFAQKAPALLIEYTEKFNRTRREIRELLKEAGELESQWLRRNRKNPRLESLKSGIRNLGLVVNRLLSAGEKLARHVSQYVEHGKLDDLTRLELTLRLAEFEGTMTASKILGF